MSLISAVSVKGQTHRDLHPTLLSAGPLTRCLADSLVYNALVIALAKAAMTVATWLFIVGICGSLIVILISFFEDLTELLGKE